MKLPIAMGELEMEALMEEDGLYHPLAMIIIIQMERINCQGEVGLKQQGLIFRDTLIKMARANDSSNPSERHELGCHEFLLREVPLPKMTTQPALDSSFWFDSSGLEVPVPQSPNSATKMNTRSSAEESFLLGNEADFPPVFVR
ncbi:hypothetical protein WN943_023128 [Citrus x changshan-huyou]